MKPVLLFLFTILVSIGSYAQDRIKFDYDTAGNQIVRRLCLDCSEFKISDEEIKSVFYNKKIDHTLFGEEEIIEKDKDAIQKIEKVYKRKIKK